MATYAGQVRVHVVSDVHGNAEALEKAGEGADAFICLGDLLLYVDYRDTSRGIMGELFGAEAVGRMVHLRTAGRFAEARDWSRGLWESLKGDRQEIIEAAVRRQYARIFAAFPRPTYLTYGNVDLPALFPDFLRDGLTLLDGQTLELGGLRFGFVGGGLRTPMRTPYEIDDDVYAAKVEAVGAVDVLCCHIPPHLPELVYDTIAGRFERGSAAILEAILRTAPRYVLFGHVHQPLASEVLIGDTRCVNVGHFNVRESPYVLEW
jgi:Icc-related predicted phosphoesterase